MAGREQTNASVTLTDTLTGDDGNDFGQNIRHASPNDGLGA